MSAARKHWIIQMWRMSRDVGWVPRRGWVPGIYIVEMQWEYWNA